MKTRLPPLNALRAFDAAARHMSFQKAAEELHVTPAAMSYQIRQLEEWLGLKLFRRLNRAVELTTHGNLIRPGIREGFERLGQSMQLLARSRSGNVLNISAGPAFTAKWLAPRMYRFIARHPVVDARISATISRVDLLSDDVDVALRFGGGTYPGCTSVKLFDEYVTPLCSPSLLEGEHSLRNPANLAHHTLIHDDTHLGIFELADWKDWLETAAVEGVKPDSGGLHFNIADHALDAAAAGAGVVLGRTVLARSDLDAGRLVAPYELWIKADFSFYAVYLDSRAEEPAIVKFRDWLVDEAAGRVEEPDSGPAV